MKILILLLLLSVILLYFKWIIIIFFYPLAVFFSLYMKKRNNITRILAFPYWVFNRKIFSGGIEKFILYYISLIPIMYVRKSLYKGLGLNIGKNVRIHYKTDIKDPYNIIIGNGTIIGDNVTLYGRRSIIIGENVNISKNVSIMAGQHNYRDPWFGTEFDKDMSITIGNRVWISLNVIILPGVKIGEGAVCCAGSLINKDVEPFSVMAGIPAKKIGERPKDLRYNFKNPPISLF